MNLVQQEIDAVNKAYAEAYAAYGATLVGQALGTWASVNRFTPGGLKLMTGGLVGYVSVAREALSTLSLRRSQLIHALQTGSVLPGDTIRVRTLQDCRDAFNDALSAVERPPALRAKALNPGTLIRLDTAAGSVEGVIESINNLTKKDVERVIKRHGEDRLVRIAKREGVVTPDEVKTSKALTASGIERLALQGGRETDAQIIQLNKRIIGYARVHNPVNHDAPCPFCAMLMTRGSAYKTAGTAEAMHYDEARQAMVQFHYNCHCTAEPVYSASQYQNHPKYALNRKLEKAYFDNISGQYHGSDIMPAWREHMKTLFPDGGRHDHEHTHDAVQEAA